MPAPPWWRAEKKQRQQLDLDAIVAAAMRIMLDEGVEAVSMRRVAGALGTGPASLYAHVRNKRELHEFMLDMATREMELPEPDPDRWREQLKQLCLDEASVLIQYPGLARVSMETLIPSTPGVLVVMDAMLGLLRCSGVPDRLVLPAADALSLYITAYAYEASLWRSNAQAEARERIGEITAYVDSLPAEQVPHLHALRAQFSSDDGEGHLETAIELFIAGLASWGELKR